jgi:hypothetical protein
LARQTTNDEYDRHLRAKERMGDDKNGYVALCDAVRMGHIL